MKWQNWMCELGWYIQTDVELVSYLNLGTKKFVANYKQRNKRRLTAFAQLSYLLNKIQFTFEVVGANVSVMVLQGCKSTLRKTDQLSLAMGDMLCK